MKYRFPVSAAPSARALRRASLSLLLALPLVPFAASAAPPAAPPAAVPEVSLEGELEVMVEDYEEYANTRYFLHSGGRRVELSFRGPPTELPSGARVKVRGRPAGTVEAVEALDVDGAASVEADATTAAALFPNTYGEQKVLVMLVNFQDQNTQPITQSSAHSLVFSNVNGFYRENSAGQAHLAGNTVGWFTLPISKSACDITAISTEADKAATAAGVNLAAYTRKVYMFPKNACAWAGLGTVGGNPSRAWINGSFSLRVVAHELGHNFGLRHAYARDCGATTLGDNCTTITYGDPADVMGATSGHFGAFNKEMLGWLNVGISAPIATASSSGRYYIDAYSATGIAAKAVKVPRGIDAASGRPLWYYVEYRRPVGYDSVLGSTSPLVSGVIVREAMEGNPNSSYFLDMTPNSSSSDMRDGALAVGKTFTDANAGVKITLAWADGQTAAVDVAVGGSTAPSPTCSAAPPTVTLSGGASQVLAGQGTAYQLTVKNNDSSACTATTFDLARELPAGWSGTLGASKLSISPGTATGTTLSVTTASDAGGGTYAVVGKASRTSGTAQASASLTVLAGDVTARVGSISLSASKHGKNYNASANATIVDQDGKALGGASVTGCFSGAVSTCGVATTDSLGRVGFGSGSYKSGSVTFCVTRVSGPNSAFDATGACRSN